jgi:uncharacterized protein (DUF488 family)
LPGSLANQNRTPREYTEHVQLFTFGHGTAGQSSLAAFIARSEIERVVDVRTVPKSARHPWVATERLASWVPEESGARYELQRDLGGFRKALPDSLNTALRNSSFRGYADYMETEPFRAALAELLAKSQCERTAVMCSETLWWRCHRRLIADAATLLHGFTVSHLTVNGKAQIHIPTAGVRVAGDRLQYDAEPA